MDRLLGSKLLPPGIRFHPTDVELCMYYLKRKVMGKSLGDRMLLSEVDVYTFSPWDLPAKACLKTRDLNWYFFCPRGRKYVHGGRTNRATECGYWKSTGNDKSVQYNNRLVGKIKTLVFYLGKAPKGERTDWVMHEYRLEDKVLADMGVALDAFVICKVYEKSGPGPKNGKHHGAQFLEEEWETDDDDNLETDSRIISDSAQLGIADRKDVRDASPLTASEIIFSTTSETHDLPVTLAPTPFSTGDNHNIATVNSPVGTSTVTIAVDDDNVGAGAGAVSAPSTTGLTSFVLGSGPMETANDELHRLLAMFTEEESNGGNQMLDRDIFSDLEDLPDGYVELDDFM